MKRYVHLKNNIVITIENEFSEVFPSIPIEKRFSKEFLDNCIIVNKDVEVRSGMVYEDGVFKEPPVIEEEETIPTEDEDVPLTAFEELKEKVNKQDLIIEELLFDIIPSLLEGDG